MEAEAAPVRKDLGLTGEGNLLAEGVTARLWSNESVHIVTNGSDSRFDVDAIGTLPASLTTLLAIEKTNPKIVISAGTCGGFTARDGFIGEIIFQSPGIRLMEQLVYDFENNNIITLIYFIENISLKIHIYF